MCVCVSACFLILWICSSIEIAQFLPTISINQFGMLRDSRLVRPWFYLWVTILFHWFSKNDKNARIKGNPFSILTVTITMIPMISSSSSSSSSSISECSMLSPLEFTKLAAMEQNCQLVYQPGAHGSIHGIKTSGVEDDLLNHILSQTVRLCSKRKFRRLKTLLGLPGHVVKNTQRREAECRL